MNHFLHFFAVCGLSFGVHAQQPAPAEPSQHSPVALDLATVRIESEAGRAFFKSRTMRVRDARTTYWPKGELPTLQIEQPTQESCRNTLRQILKLNEREDAQIRMLGGLMYAKQKDVSAWIHTASGGFKCTVTRNSMTERTRFKDFKEAVQKAADYVARNRLVELSDGEEVDIVAVSGVNNVLSEVKSPEEPIELFLSDYYVSFGRRYRGVPVIGSHITLRFDGFGHVAMVSRNWRRIVAAKEQVALSAEPLVDLIAKSREFREAGAKDEVGAKDIHLSYVRGGYVEAPFDHVQELLRPGVLVSFWVGATRDEMDRELLLPLERDGDSARLLGSRGDWGSRPQGKAGGR